MSKPRVLVVEDDSDIREVLRYNLRLAGYEVTTADDGMAGLRAAEHDPPDVVILDLMLPSVDGKEVCRRLRAWPQTADTLIMMLTAKAEESDQVEGLAIGADDYVTKPFSVKVVLERLKALRRRRLTEADTAESIESQGVVIDLNTREARLHGRALPLTQSEFRLLETLVRSPGRAYQRRELIEAALGHDSYVLERTIDVHIRALRRKLGDAAHLIETVRGYGYRFRGDRPAEE